MLFQGISDVFQHFFKFLFIDVGLTQFVVFALDFHFEVSLFFSELLDLGLGVLLMLVVIFEFLLRLPADVVDLAPQLDDLLVLLSD